MRSPLQIFFDMLDRWHNSCRREIRTSVNGKDFVVREYGRRHWKKIVFTWPNKSEFYRVKRGFGFRPDLIVSRREFFEGEPGRKYIGPRNCFIEFVNILINETGDLDQPRSFASLGLGAETIEMYIKYSRKFFA